MPNILKFNRLIILLTLTGFPVSLWISCGKKTDKVDFGYDIILNIGQSNTHFGYGYDELLDASDDRILQLGRHNGNDMKVIPAVEPLDHYTAKDKCIGFAMTFSKYYADEFLDPGRKILIIPCGKSGSAFIKNHWNKGDPLYNDAVERVKFVLDNFPNSKLKAILWHQGESDEGNEDYKKQLDQFIANLREDLDAQVVPFILGGMVPYWVNQHPQPSIIQEIIADTPNRIPFTGYVDPENPFIIEKVNNSENQIHYNANGQRELGKRYFKEYVKLRY